MFLYDDVPRQNAFSPKAGRYEMTFTSAFEHAGGSIELHCRDLNSDGALRNVSLVATKVASLG